MDKAPLDITLALKTVSACNRLVLVTKEEPVPLTEEMHAAEQRWASDLKPSPPCRRLS